MNAVVERAMGILDPAADQVGFFVSSDLSKIIGQFLNSDCQEFHFIEIAYPCN